MLVAPRTPPKMRSKTRDLFTQVDVMKIIKCVTLFTDLVTPTCVNHSLRDINILYINGILYCNLEDGHPCQTTRD